MSGGVHLLDPLGRGRLCGPLQPAGNASFTQMLSVISIPDSMAAVDMVVLELWENYLQFVKTDERLNRFLDRSLIVSTIERLGCHFLDVPQHPGSRKS